MNESNPVGLRGIEFIEFVSPDPDALHRLFSELGFSRTMTHSKRAMDLYEQGDIHLVLNRQTGSLAAAHARAHGPSISSMGWRVKDARRGQRAAIARGARPCDEGDLAWSSGAPLPAIHGIGESLIYLTDDYRDPDRYERLGFVRHPSPVIVGDKGFTAIDHLTNNVPHGTLQTWASFYKGVFGFTVVRYFDIRGVQTGLVSYALRSPCGSFCIPINEAVEAESQINEYLREYRGPGIQHLAFLTQDLLRSLDALHGTSIETLDIDDDYYDSVFDRVPNVTEDHAALRKHKVLVDGDEAGYLLQIFTKNVVGPIFIEFIQRKNHLSFGEGNFGALFRSIERDQQKRGVLEAR